MPTDPKPLEDGHDLEIADVAREKRDSEWVKAVKKARVKWLGNAVAACDEILREMGVKGRND